MQQPSFDWEEKYRRLNAGHKPGGRRPLIGITGNYEDRKCTLAATYYRSVLRAGGLPVVIPPFRPDDRASLAQLPSLLEPLDGILFSGGGDINPLLLGEEPIPQLHAANPERDEQELLLARLAADRQLPILGICKGVQVVTAALGGELYQDIYAQQPGAGVKHAQDIPRECASHTVSIAPGTVLHGIYRQEELAVNSFHHQAVKSPAPGMRVSAVAPDGVIEAVESADFKSILGVQWHPECLPARPGSAATDRGSEPGDVFDWLVREAASFQQAKRLHRRILTLDSHEDTPMFFHLATQPPFNGHVGRFFAMRNPSLLVDLHKMDEGRLDAAIMVAYLEQKERDEASLLSATAKASRILSQIEEMVAYNCTAIDIARTPDDLLRLKREGKHAIMLGIENGYAVGRDLANVAHFRRQGVVYMTLCHNGDNDICDSARGRHEHGGISPFGADVVREMNRHGMMADLSHADEKSFYDALGISSQPIVCSHSSARALCDHPRNLTDDQLRALARQGGVAQVTLYHGFLRPAPEEATVLDAINHLNHMVSVMGVDHVGIGTDFDGDGGIRGCASASELINFTRRLLAERYSEGDIEKIWGGNFLRVMRQVQGASLRDVRQ